jgi:CrcB protein
MKEFLLVFIGFSVSRLFINVVPAFPFATLVSNILSCTIFGMIMMLGVNRLNLHEGLKLLLITGFCGGFSTYSAFTFETVELFKQGQAGMAVLNIILNFILSVSGLYLGIVSIKLFA